MDKIGLAEAIGALRRELGAAADASAGEDLRFRVGTISVELEVVTERATQGSAGVKFWVVEMGAEHTRSAGHTHRVRIELTPVVASGSLLTGDDRIPG